MYITTNHLTPQVYFTDFKNTLPNQCPTPALPFQTPIGITTKKSPGKRRGLNIHPKSTTQLFRSIAQPIPPSTSINPNDPPITMYSMF